MRYGFVLQCVAECCSVLQRVAACGSMLQRVVAECDVWLTMHMCDMTHSKQAGERTKCWLICSPIYIARCVAECCNVLQRESNHKGMRHVTHQNASCHT